MTKKIIGRVDNLDFPELKLYDIPCKIDTGAYTSAIHCTKVILKDSTLHCYFNIGNEAKPIIFNEFSLTDVKSSNGFKENRFKVKSQVIVFGKCYKINLTLSTRDDMKFPVLIGRQFLSKKFMVDVDLENVSASKKTYEHCNSI